VATFGEPGGVGLMGPGMLLAQVLVQETN
jgi:hypothetical protein